jgi:hypothetical protein
MSTNNERNLDPIQEMTRIAQSFLNLGSWGFQESYRSARPGNLIYDSEWCRVNLIWGGWDYAGGNSINIRYGRLHAPNENSMLIWKGEECHCWHRFEYALHFLDGRTPIDAAKLDFSHSITDPFYESEIREEYRHRQPEWLARMHAAVWEQYGKHLFGLFDLRRPEAWEKYQQFLKGVYDVKGRTPHIQPPLDKVC